MRLNWQSILRPVLLLLLYLSLGVAGAPACKYQVGTDLMDLAAPDLRPPPSPDLRAPRDLSVPPDLGGICSGMAGQRRCSPDLTQSGSCSQDALTFLPDHTCSAGGRCSYGHCLQPDQAISCQSDANCPARGDLGASGLYCQPFTNVFNRSGFYCVPAVGKGTVLSQCSADTDCIWNLCYSFLGDVPRCTKPCSSSAECGAMGQCGALEPIIEGFKVATNYCLPK